MNNLVRVQVCQSRRELSHLWQVSAHSNSRRKNHRTHEPNAIILHVVQLRLHELTESSIVHPGRDHTDAICVREKSLVQTEKRQDMRVLQLTPDDGLLVQHLENNVSWVSEQLNAADTYLTTACRLSLLEDTHAFDGYFLRSQ
jgi:hypothetical protein